MLLKTRGIVFRAMKYRETSLILDVFTEEKGLRKYIINGVRSPKARTKANQLQVMSLIDVVAYERSDRDLLRLKEVKPAWVYQSIPFELRKGAVGLFIAEIARKSIKESEENRPLFRFLFDTFTYLDRTEHPVHNLHLHFLLELSTLLGFTPNGHFTTDGPFFDMQEGSFRPQQSDHRHFLQPPLSQHLDQLMDAQQDNVHLLTITNTERRELLSKLLDYYRLHLHNFPEIKAHLILQEVLG